jgi:hypothetical protein
LCRTVSGVFGRQEAARFLPPTVQAGPRDVAFSWEGGFQFGHDIVKGRAFKAGNNEGFDFGVGFDLGGTTALVGGTVSGLYIAVKRAFNAPFKRVFKVSQIMVKCCEFAPQSGHESLRVLGPLGVGSLL